MSQERSVTYVSGLDIEKIGSPGRTRTYDPAVNSRLKLHFTVFLVVLIYIVFHIVMRISCFLTFHQVSSICYLYVTYREQAVPISTVVRNDADDAFECPCY